MFHLRLSFVSDSARTSFKQMDIIRERRGRERQMVIRCVGAGEMFGIEVPMDVKIKQNIENDKWRREKAFSICCKKAMFRFSFFSATSD